MPSFEPFQHFPDHHCVENLKHPSHAYPGIHPFPEKLWVVACLDNPLRWRSRYANYQHFAHHVECAGAVLITVESALRDRHFEVTEAGNPYHVQVRCQDELFRKENLQNVGVSRLPLGTKYVAFIDADITFARPDWAQETLHLLQHYQVIQMFSSFTDLGPHHEVLRSMPSFLWNYFHEDGTCSVDHSGYGGWLKGKKWSGAPGLAWAYRVEALDDLGGLLDRCILGGGDSHMAYGLMQQTELARLHHEIANPTTDAYRHYIAIWQANAVRLQKNVGYMQGSVLHKWHGAKAKRGYSWRWRILERNQFDPFVDVMEDHQGVLRLTGNKPQLRDDLREYLRSRDEDSLEL